MSSSAFDGFMCLLCTPNFVQIRLYSFLPITHVGDPISAQNPLGLWVLVIFVSLEA